jgi:S-adenosylmethionine decarboxylase
MNNKGNHSIADIYYIENLKDDALIDLCDKAIKKSGLTVIKKVEHLFIPFGATCVWILSESHFTLHTYPEHNYFSVDCYTCGENGTPFEAIKEIIKNINVKKCKLKNLNRG